MSDIAADVAKVRRNTGIVAGVLLGYLTLIAVLFVFSSWRLDRRPEPHA